MADIQISDLPGRTTPAGTDLMHVEASGADYKAELSALVNAVTDAAPTEDSPAPVSSGGVFDALSGKQDTLTFDDEPTEDSENPVTSGGVYSAISKTVIAGSPINVTLDISSAGLKYVDFTAAPTTLDGKSFIGYMGRTTTYRTYFTGIGGDRAYYNVVDPLTISYGVIIPLYA